MERRVRVLEDWSKTPDDLCAGLFHPFQLLSWVHWGHIETMGKANILLGVRTYFIYFLPLRGSWLPRHTEAQWSVKRRGGLPPRERAGLQGRESGPVERRQLSQLKSSGSSYMARELSYMV